jgi:hypothetical protein
MKLVVDKWSNLIGRVFFKKKKQITFNKNQGKNKNKISPKHFSDFNLVFIFLILTINFLDFSHVSNQILA